MHLQKEFDTLHTGNLQEEPPGVHGICEGLGNVSREASLEGVKLVP